MHEDMAIRRKKNVESIQAIQPTCPTASASAPSNSPSLIPRTSLIPCTVHHNPNLIRAEILKETRPSIHIYSMDWFGWLSRTGLDPELAYVYGLELTRNELQEEDLPYFDHEFLQSMGISIAKHRLEILKLARKDASRADRRLSGLVNVISRTKRSVGKYIGRLISHEPTGGARENTRGAMTRKDDSDKEVKHRSLALSGPLDAKYQHKYLADARRSPKFSGPLMHGPRSPNLLWPLDAKPHEEVILTSGSPKSSGPVDRRPVMNGSPRFPRPLERATSGSPRISGPLEGTGPSPRVSPRVHGDGNFQNERVVNGFDEHSLWAKLFHDMKPT